MAARRLLSDVIDLSVPIVQAPMAGVQDQRLALAVSEAGGLGSLPCALLTPSLLEAALIQISSHARPVNLNFFCHLLAGPGADEEARWRNALQPYYQELDVAPPEPTTAGVRRPIDDATVEMLARFEPKVVSFHFGLPRPDLLDRIRAWGAVVMASATTVDEGRWLERNGVDIVIAQGIEAGGHRGHFLSDDLSGQLSTLDLARKLSTALTLPVIAAGGIGSAVDVAEALDAGAMAAQVGTAYLLCPEATTSAIHREALQQEGRPSAVTNLFSGRPARGLVNRLMRELGPVSSLPPSFPWAAQALTPLRQRAEALGRDDFTPLWSGTKPGRFAGCTADAITRRLAGMN